MVDLPVKFTTAAIAGRAVWGAGLVMASLTMPPRLGGGGLGLLTGILGVRHLGQAAVNAGHPVSAGWRIGALLDGLQAGGMVVLAGHPRTAAAARPLAMLDAAIASGFCATEIRAARRVRS